MQSPPTILEQISTRWPQISDPAQFVFRYAPAISRYLGALLRDAHAVDDVTQDLMLHLLQLRLNPERIQRGRFRDYLRAIVRNAALTYLRRKQTRAAVSLDTALEPDDRDEDPARQAERAWQGEWRRCLVERALDALDCHERSRPGSRASTVLRVAIEYVDEDSTTQASRVAELTGETMSAEAFRKQLSRARRLFARCLIQETALTLEHPRAEDIEEELAELELWNQVQPFLPDDWRTSADLMELR